MSETRLFIGLMSGTSLDGVDGVLAAFGAGPPRLIATRHDPFPIGLREDLLALNARGDDELHRAALAANRLADSYHEIVAALLAQAGVAPDRITAIGCHGQTVRHRPELGYSLQLNNPARLAERSDITVVADFRSRDLAAGGQGAPLVPAFHRAVFASPRHHRVIVNIGGIANLTDLAPDGVTRGFDCGPGNVLMDAWCRHHTGQPFDRDGALAASGRIIPALLDRLRAEPFLDQSPPKSTGRDLFNWQWLEARLDPSWAAADVQATLLALTTETIAASVRRHCTGAESVYVCGGGARNRTLMEALTRMLAEDGISVASTAVLGIEPEWVEALAFAWLASRAVDRLPGNLPEATGARHPCVLGAIYPH